MTAREIVRRTVEFEGPERVARSFGESDFVGAEPDIDTPETDWQATGDGRWERLDAWGNVWGRVDPTSMGEVVRGALESMDDADTYEFPDYSDPASYEPVRRKRNECPDHWLNGGLPGFAFNIARKLRKLEQYFIDLLADADRIHALHDRIDAMLEDMIRNYAAADVDGVMFCEDWGTQNGLLIDPALWRSEFGPRFEKLCGIAHDAGIKMFMHSCGQTEPVVPDMVAAGIDLLQFDQPELHGLDVLAGRQEHAKITFWCPVDIQKTLQTRDEALIRTRVREMLDTLWRGRGGFVAGYYGDNESIGLDPKWQAIASDEFSTYGVQANFGE